MSLWAILLTISGVVVSIWASFRYFLSNILYLNLRINTKTFKTLFNEIKNSNKILFLFSEEISNDTKFPLVLQAFIRIKGKILFYLDHNERLLHSYQTKDSVSQITCFRWDFNKLKNYIAEIESKEIEKIPVNLLTDSYLDYLGNLKYTNFIPYGDYKDIEDNVNNFLETKKGSIGLLLYGPPGCGKTTFVKYLATKYKLPIQIMVFEAKYSNKNILYMFSKISERCIVLLEDFDNIFDKRQPIFGKTNNTDNNISFTFDAILNGLDGIYNSYEQVIFIMTANNINKIDDSLKNRPSRFKLVKEIKYPNNDTKKQLIGEDWSKYLNNTNLNLDQLIRLKEYKENNYSLNKSLELLNLKQEIELN